MLQMAAGGVGHSMNLSATESTLVWQYCGRISTSLPIRRLSLRCDSFYNGESVLTVSKLRLESPSSPLFSTSSSKGVVRQQLWPARTSSQDPSIDESSMEVQSAEFVGQEAKASLPECWKWSKTTEELVAYGLRFLLTQ